MRWGLTPSRMAGPRLLSRRIWRAGIESARSLDVALRLLAADLRGEIAEERQLLDHAEVVRGRIGGDGRRGTRVRADGRLLPLTRKEALRCRRVGFRRVRRGRPRLRRIAFRFALCRIAGVHVR